jgi:hypothetical protein
MALLMMEGFDHYQPSVSGDDRQSWWKGWIGTPFGATDGRYRYGAQSQAMEVINLNPVHKAIPSPPPDNLVLGFAFQVSALATGTVVSLVDQTFEHQAYLGITSGGNFTISDGTNTHTGTFVIQARQWYFVELKVSAGYAEVHVNGSGADIGATVDIAPVLGDYSWPWYLVVFQADWGLGGWTYVDDFYLCDLTGPTNNDFLGEVIVQTLYPTADGTHRDWTPDTGSDHYPRVNEEHVDLYASYVQTATTGATDTYSVGAALPDGTPVLGAQLNLGIIKTDTGTRSVQSVVRQAGTDHFSPDVYVPGDWGFISWLLDQDPTGANWDYSKINADEYGVKVTS